MTYPRLPIVSIAALALGAFAGGTGAGEIFKWVDDEGTVHYSDTQPADVDAVETFRLEKTNAADYDPASDPYSILNQAARIGDAWADTQLESRARARPGDDARDYDYEDWGYGDYLEPQYPAYVTPVYLPTRRPVSAARHAPNAARRQVSALETLDMTGRRPHSINSGTHRERVLESRDLPLATPR